MKKILALFLVLISSACTSDNLGELVGDVISLDHKVDAYDVHYSRSHYNNCKKKTYVCIDDYYKIVDESKNIVLEMRSVVAASPEDVIDISLSKSTAIVTYKGKKHDFSKGASASGLEPDIAKEVSLMTQAPFKIKPLIDAKINQEVH